MQTKNSKYSCTDYFFGENFLSQPKNLTAFSAYTKTFVPAEKTNFTNALSFYRSQIVLGWSKFFVPDQKFIYILWQSHALSFYRSQNVLGWSKFFVRDQKFIHILWQSQTFCARQKDDLHSVKLVFVPAQKFLKRH